MQAGNRYSLFQAVNWTRNAILSFIGLSIFTTGLYFFLELKWIAIPWQPMSVIGIAVAFYLGFKNNSSYERLWEARKIWGGIVNASRTYTIMVRDFITNEHAQNPLSEQELTSIHKRIVHRHVAWLRALTIQLRKVQDWEHNGKSDNYFREFMGLDAASLSMDEIKPYLSEEEFNYLSKKGNVASHLVSLQSKELKDLKMKGLIEDFRHMELENMLKEFYALQGKSERIKNFPFPRQYATANYFFVMIFIILLPFTMLSVFQSVSESWMIWFSVPFSVLASWVFWMMESIGEYSENPFEGLYNDVPITSMARGIEIDIRQMLEETDLPEPLKPTGDLKILY